MAQEGRGGVNGSIMEGDRGILDGFERIFEPFERITTIDRPVEGLGLGLAICRKIVEAHGWKIDYVAPPRAVRSAK